MIFRPAFLFSFFLAAGSGVAFAQAPGAGAPTVTPVPGAPAVPNNGGGATNPGIAPPPQPVAPNAGSGSSTNQAGGNSGGTQGAGSSTNQTNSSRRTSRRQNNAANTRQTTVNQTGGALDQTAARRQGDMTEQRRAGTAGTTGNDHP